MAKKIYTQRDREKFDFRCDELETVQPIHMCIQENIDQVTRLSSLSLPLHTSSNEREQEEEKKKINFCSTQSIA